MMRKISKCCYIILPIKFDFKWPNKGQRKMFDYFARPVDNQQIEAINDLLI